MKIAYLVFAYKNPQLIKKTVDHLAGPDASFFVHIDAKAASNHLTSCAVKTFFSPTGGSPCIGLNFPAWKPFCF